MIKMDAIPSRLQIYKIHNDERLSTPSSTIERPIMAKGEALYHP